jgi:hypothetical protein
MRGRPDFHSFQRHETPRDHTPGSLASDPPFAWIDASLLAFAERLGDRISPPLIAARTAIRESGDDESRARLEELSKVANPASILDRLHTILSRRPTRGERDAAALVHFSEGEMLLALLHAVPGAFGRTNVRLARRGCLEHGYATARRIGELPEQMEDAWCELGYEKPPSSIWRWRPPSSFHGGRDLAIEISPNPSSYNEAMFVGRRGAGRTVVALMDPRFDGAVAPPTAAEVFPSGWPPVTRLFSGCIPISVDDPDEAHARCPATAPMPRAFVRVPDLDLFALCAARTWTGSLADAIWLRRRDDHRALW